MTARSSASSPTPRAAPAKTRSSSASGTRIRVTPIVAGRSGIRQLLASIVRWRVNVGWYALALLGLPAVYTASIALVPGALASYNPLSLSDVMLFPVLYLYLGASGGPLTEEPG